MAQLLPPTPVGVPPGHSFWNDWYEKLRSLINGINDGLGNFLSVNGDGFIVNVGIIASGDIAEPNSDGIILVSPNGNQYRLVVDNTGVLDTEQIA